LMDAVLERFIAHSPMAVAVRGAFEYALAPAPLDDLFVRAVGHRDDRQLLFSTCVDRMATVVCRVEPSVHAAYQDQDHMPVPARARPHPGNRGRERRVGGGPELLHHRVPVRDRPTEGVLRHPAARGDTELGAGIRVGGGRADGHRDAGRGTGTG